MADSSSSAGQGRSWAALVIEAHEIGLDDLVSAALDDYSPAAIEDLTPQPLPPDAIWDPTFPQPPDPPPSPLHWRVFFGSTELRDRAAGELAGLFPGLSIEHVDVADENWAARSQASLTAVRAGDFIVAPPWDIPQHPEPQTTTIVVEPSRGFGTGHHASTRLCLRAMSGIELRGTRVLDLGTGSGVLAMAAALRGAREVVAIDIDPDAIEAARASAALNALPVNIDFQAGDFRGPGAALTPGGYDVVLANLTGGMLAKAASRVFALAAPGGLLVASGIGEHEQQSVRDAFAAMPEVATFAEDGWVALVLQKRS